MKRTIKKLFLGLILLMLNTCAISITQVKNEENHQVLGKETIKEFHYKITKCKTESRCLKKIDEFMCEIIQGYDQKDFFSIRFFFYVADKHKESQCPRLIRAYTLTRKSGSLLCGYYIDSESFENGIQELDCKN